MHSVLLYNQLRLEKVKAGRKGNLNVATEVMQENPELVIYFKVNFVCLTFIMHFGSDTTSRTLSSYGRSPKSKRRHSGIP